MSTHTLKTDPEAFQAVAAGLKTFEIRLDDRGFQVGDALHLLETVSTGAEMKAGAPLAYTGASCLVTVSHILRGPIYGLADGWAILSLARAQKEEPREGWIAVSARIPEFGAKVLAYCASWGTNADHPFLAHHSGLATGFVDTRRGTLMAGVTHWMHLPSAPIITTSQ